MNRFELTERGKIVIAVVLVVILLVIPSTIIFAVSSCSDSSPPDTSSSPVIPGLLPGEDGPGSISNSPLPTGSGFDPSDPEPSGHPETPEPAPDATPETSPSPSPTPAEAGGDNGDGDSSGGGDDSVKPGPVGLNVAAGTMEFLYAPNIDKMLDEDTVGMLGEFLSSPKNTNNALIRVEMPNISTYDQALLESAVTHAFSAYDVSESSLLFVKTSVNITEREFEVSLSYEPIKSQK